MATKGYSAFRKSKHYWNLTIRLFTIISRTLVGWVLPLCREAVCIFYSPSQLRKLILGIITKTILFWINSRDDYLIVRILLGVMANVLDCSPKVSEFEPQSFYYLHLCTNSNGNDMNLLISQLSIKYYHFCSTRMSMELLATKFDMPLNKETKPKNS